MGAFGCLELCLYGIRELKCSSLPWSCSPVWQLWCCASPPSWPDCPVARLTGREGSHGTSHCSTPVPLVGGEGEGPHLPPPLSAARPAEIALVWWYSLVMWHFSSLDSNTAFITYLRVALYRTYENKEQLHIITITISFWWMETHCLWRLCSICKCKKNYLVFTFIFFWSHLI